MPDVNHVILTNRSDTVGGNDTLSVGRNHSVTVGSHHTHSVGQSLTVTVGKKLRLEAADEIELVVGAASLLMKKDGSIVLRGVDIQIAGAGNVDVKSARDVLIKGRKIGQN